MFKMWKSFLFMLVFITYSSFAVACVSFNSVFFHLFRRCCALGTTGVPDSLIQPYLKAIVTGLISNFGEKYLPETKLNKICISPRILSRFGLELEPKGLTWMSSNMYRTQLSELALSKEHEEISEMMNSDKKSVILRTWFRVSNHLSSPVSKVNVEALSQLPSTLELLYDPNYHIAQDELWKYTSDTRDIIAAPALVENVLTIILKMERLNMPRPVSVQLLEHCAALVFLGCRVHRKEFNDLFIPSIFASMYNEVLHTRVNATRLAELPDIPEGFVRMHFNEEIRDLTSFKTLGRLRYHVLSPDCRVTLKDLRTEVFTKMMLINDELKTHRVNNMPAKQSETIAPASLQSRSSTHIANVHKFSGQRVSLEASTRITSYFRKVQKCPSTHTFYKLQERSGPKNCCAAICGSIELIHRLGLTSKKKCCLECNLAKCAIRESLKLTSLTTMHLPPWGLSPARSVSITI